MIAGAIIIAILAFLFGWFMKDYRWVNAAKKDKIMVVEGNMYKVKQYAEKSGGSVEE